MPFRSLWALILLCSPSVSLAGPFPPAAGVPGSTALSATDASIVGWANGYIDYLPGASVDAQFQTPARALHAAGNSDGGNAGFIFDIVSLGESGAITLAFDPPIANGAGNDFAVFENSFSDSFLELAWVEVSSNGVDFYRFNNVSLTPGSVGAFGTIDTTDIFGYGGKYRGGYGTPFDLQDLVGQPALDTDRVLYVRIVDITGDGSAFDTLPPPSGPLPIYDPYPGNGSVGFDLDAVAVLHQAEPLAEENAPLPGLALLVLMAVLLGIGSKRITVPAPHVR